MSIPTALAKIRPNSGLGRFMAENAVGYMPSLAKFREDPDRSVLTKIFGVPVGFQFGTAMGMDGVPALVTDIVTDPVGWLFAFGKMPFALTRAGRAAKGTRGLLGTVEGTKMARAAKFVAEGNLPLEQAREAIAGGIMTAGRLDVADLRKAGRVLEESSDAVNATARLMNFREERIGQTVRALDTGLAGKPAIAEEIAEIQGRIDKLRRSSKSRNAAQRIDALEKQKAALQTQLRTKPIPKRQGRPEFRNDQITRVIDAVRAGGIEGGKALIAREMTNRASLVNRARKGFSNLQEYIQFEKDILKLDPSARTLTMLRDNKEVLRTFVEEAAAGRLHQPLTRGGLQAEVAEGSRALFGVKLPLVGEKTLIKGEKLAGVVEEMLRKHRGLEAGKPLVLGARSAGLVQGSAKATREMNRLLGVGPRMADFSTVQESAASAASALDAVGDDVTRFKNSHEAWNAELHRAEILSSRLRFDLEAAMANAGMTVEKDGLLIQRLIDNPDLYLKREGATAIGRTLRETAVFGEINEAGKAAGITEKHMLLAESIDTALRQAKGKVAAEGLVESFLGNYFPHRISEILKPEEWNKVLPKLSGEKKMSTFYRHGLPRVFDTVDELLEFEKAGIIKVEKNPAKILQAYFSEAGRAAANKRQLRNLRQGKWQVSLRGVSPKFARRLEEQGGLPLIVRPGKGYGKWFRDEYEWVDDNDIITLVRAIEREEGRSGRKARLIVNGKVGIKKEILKPLKTIYAPQFRNTETLSFTERMFEAGLRINAYSKRGLLFWSGFHGIALTESAIADVGTDFFRAFPSIAKELPNTVASRSHRSFFDAEDIIQAATKTGLALGRPLDPDIEIFRQALNFVEKKVPVMTPATRAAGKMEGVFNRSLWDYYHNGLKLFAWDTLYQRALVRHGSKPANQIARAVSEHVNNAFGGQVWENFWVSKGGQRALRMFLMAPDWTFSNARIAMDVFGNFFKKNEAFQSLMTRNGFLVTTDDILRADIRATYARQYALRTGLIFAVFANIANMAFSGHFMDDNDEGFKSQIRLPFDDGKGRPLYLRFGKQFREPFEMLTRPWDFLNRKLAYAPQQAWMQITNRDFFGRPLVTSEDGPIQSLFKRTGHAAQGFTPIPVQEFLGLGGRGEADMLGGVSGLIGLPVKRPFQRGNVSPDRIALQEEMFRQLFDSSGLQIPEQFGDLTDERSRSGFFSQIQDNMLSVPGVPTGF